MARPKIVWSAKEYKYFDNLCSLQATVSDIENVLDIDHKTIDRLCREHYFDSKGKSMSFSQVYIKYSEKGKMSLRMNQFELSKKSAAMAIFLDKQYLGQKDEQSEKIKSLPFR